MYELAKQILEINDKDIFFKIGKSKYKIGSRMFPVAQKSKLKIFDNTNTTDIDNQLLIKNIEQNKHLFEIGRCHRNTEVIYKIGKALNLNVEYYTGWLFLGDEKPPIFHSFAVFENNVIDISNSQVKQDIGYTINWNSPNCRKEYAQKMADFQTSTIPYKNKITFGKVVEDYIYIGCPNNFNQANSIFKRLMTNFPNHISYQQYGMNMSDKSLIQKDIESLIKNKT